MYICVTLGALDGLNRYSCFIIEDGFGGYLVKFVANKEVPEAIGVPFAADSVNDSLNSSNSSLESPESVRNTFTRENSLWRDRSRGFSLQNSRDCDEITRQFLDIDFNDDMILRFETDREVSSSITNI